MTTQPAPVETGDVNYCPRNTGVETNLRCGKCGQFICPRCMVQTPVGARCPDCAKMKKNPAYDPSSQETTLAVGAGFGVAVACGAVVALAAYLFARLGVGLIGAQMIVLVGLGASGWLVGETIYRTARFKRSRSLSYVAALAAFAAYLSGMLVAPVLGLSSGTFVGLYPLLGLGLAVYTAMGRVKP